jgi:hypothetical protein
MRSLLSMLLCCGVVAAQTMPPIIRHLNSGDGKQALDAAPDAEQRLARLPYGVRLIIDSVQRYIEGKGRDKAEAETIGKLVDLAVRVSDKLVQEKDADAERHLLLARARCMTARWKRVHGSADWLDTSRAAAKALAAFEAAGAPRLRARAVSILCAAARQEGAPAEKLLAEARALAGDAHAAPGMAMQLGLARYEWALGRKREAEEALAPFIAEHDALSKSDDVDRLTIYNDAVVFAKANGIARALEFIMIEHDGASLRFSVPRSHRWVVGEVSENGADIVQRLPDGDLRREITIFNLPEDGPSSDPAARSPNNKTRARYWIPAAERNMVKLKRKARPKSSRLSRGLRGVAMETSGWEGDQCPQARLFFLFRGKRLKKSFGTIIVKAFGDDAVDDPDAAAFFASFVDG